MFVPRGELVVVVGVRAAAGRLVPARAAPALDFPQLGQGVVVEPGAFPGAGGADAFPGGAFLGALVGGAASGAGATAVDDRAGGARLLVGGEFPAVDAAVGRD